MPWALQVSLHNSHSLLYVTKEAHIFPPLNSSLTTLHSTPANFPHDVIIPLFSSVPATMRVILLYVVYNAVIILSSYLNLIIDFTMYFYHIYA